MDVQCTKCFANVSNRSCLSLLGLVGSATARTYCYFLELRCVDAQTVSTMYLQRPCTMLDHVDSIAPLRRCTTVVGSHGITWLLSGVCGTGLAERLHNCVLGHMLAN